LKRANNFRGRQLAHKNGVILGRNFIIRKPGVRQDAGCQIEPVYREGLADILCWVANQRFQSEKTC